MYIEINKTDIDSIKENHEEFVKNNKSIKLKGTTFLLKKLTRLLQVQMMTKECNQLIR